MPYQVSLIAPGGPEQFKVSEVAKPTPQKGEVLLRHEAVGLNFIDIYHRTGFYPLPSYPAVIGLEGAGIVEAVGEGVNMPVGTRVAYGAGPMGAYAQWRTIQVDKLVVLPDSVSCETAAAIMLKGLTAWYLLRRTFVVGKEHTILVHAAAGGVGLLLCRWAKHLGARVIGTVSNDAKATLAREAGCDEIILYRKEPVAERVRSLTGGQGVHVVYDAVGKDTFQASLDSLAKRGLFVSYGQASGPMPHLDSQLLSRGGSLFFTRPTLTHYVETPQEYAQGASELISLVENGILKVHIGQKFALKDVAAAHKTLESGATTGATVLTP